MANFGFRRLAVVAPFEAHWREARSAVGAPDLMARALETESLAEAVADCTLVVGTGTLGRRKAEQPVVPLPELAQRVAAEMERGGRVALVFGSEKRGLTREDLAQCHLLVEIPTDARQPSMNLGQAIAVCLYEIATSPTLNAEIAFRMGHPASGADGSEKPHPSRKNKNPAVEGMSAEASRVGRPADERGTSADRNTDAPASTRDLELLAGVVEETMAAANYSPAAMRRANRHDVRLLLRRLTLSRRDARRALGLFRRILWRLQHPAHGADGEPLGVTHK